jgi:hypothetical protein
VKIQSRFQCCTAAACANLKLPRQWIIIMMILVVAGMIGIRVGPARAFKFEPDKNVKIEFGSKKGYL